MKIDTKKGAASPPNLVRLAVAAIITGVPLSLPQIAIAQDSGADEELTEVTVTGTRIVRRDVVANSPLVTIDSAAIEQRSGLNIESYLNQLPNYNPAASPVTTNQDVQISAVNSVGVSTVSLRGFGPNRGLVLVDGRRAMPTNALMVVDINTIPSSMIRRVEIISGGASAVYGADAISGVTNFMLRRDFEGMEFDIQRGATEVGDGEELRASAIFGTRSADNRGNVVFAAEYYDRKAAYDKERDFYTDAWRDPTVAGNFLGFVFGLNGYNTLFNPPNIGTLRAIQAGRPQGTDVYPFGSTGTFQGLRFNPDGSIWVPNGANAWDFGLPLDHARFSLVDAYDTTRCTAPNPTVCPDGPQLIQQIKYNETEGYTSSPQTRYSLMASGTYDITDSIQFFSSARFAESETRTFLAGTNASFGWEVSVPYDPNTDSPVLPTLDFTNDELVAAVLEAARTGDLGIYANPNFIPTGAQGAKHPVPLEFAMLLNSRPNPAGDWVLETYPLNSFGRRETDNVTSAWQIEAGFKFDLPLKDWTGELYYSRGQSSTYNVASGSNSLARWRGMVLAPDYGRGANLQSNLTHNLPSANPGFGSVPVHCTSGFYDTIFHGDTPASEDCVYGVSARLQTRTENQQDIFEVNFQGGLFELPAGEVRGAIGYQTRRNSAQFNPDILQSTSEFNDQVIGVYPTGYLDAETTHKDVFAELLIPILKDKLVDRLELEIGGRHSEMDGHAINLDGRPSFITAAENSTDTFKITGNVQFTPSFRLRGGFNRAIRAPNLGELFLNLQQIFTAGGTFADPCSVLSNSPFGAGGAYPNYFPGGAPSQLASGQTPEGAMSTYLICREQMGPDAARIYYGSPNDPLTQPPPTAGGGFAWVNQIGNPNLKPETGDTWTAGLVIQSPFDNVFFRGLTATIDWYQIEIEDAILPYSIDYARWLCYGAVVVSTPEEARAQANSPACQNVPRNQANGTALNQLVSYDNQAWVKTAGIDFAINWYAQFSDLGLERIPGGLNVNVQGNYLDYYKTKTSPASFDPVVDWKGSLGPTLQGFNPGSYEYRLFTSISYTLPTFNVSLRWRHLPSIWASQKAVEDAIKRNNAAVAAGAPGTILTYTPITNLKADSYDVFDLSVFWNVTDRVSIRAGIDNLFDKQPVITGATAGYPYDPSLSAEENAARLASVCGDAPGCRNPTAYALPTSGRGTTDLGFYDILGRRYFIGVKASF